MGPSQEETPMTPKHKGCTPEQSWPPFSFLSWVGTPQTRRDKKPPLPGKTRL